MYMPYGFYWDKSLLILIPAILLSAYASYKVNSVTQRYFRVKSYEGRSGYEVARIILDSNGLNNISINPVQGNLTDHYDPMRKSINLSEEVYYGTSITSISVAAHECGHAIQHKVSYVPFSIRSAIVPAVNFASSISWIIIMLGFFINNRFLWMGIILFSASVLFQIVTLPVEFNASSRALKQLTALNLMSDEEHYQGKKVLQAAALTYVAAALASILQLARLIFIANSRDND